MTGERMHGHDREGRALQVRLWWLSRAARVCVRARARIQKVHAHVRVQ